MAPPSVTLTDEGETVTPSPSAIDGFATPVSTEATSETTSRRLTLASFPSQPITRGSNHHHASPREPATTGSQGTRMVDHRACPAPRVANVEVPLAPTGPANYRVTLRRPFVLRLPGQRWSAPVYGGSYSAHFQRLTSGRAGPTRRSGYTSVPANRQSALARHYLGEGLLQ